jgi:hypothetical protein
MAVMNLTNTHFTQNSPRFKFNSNFHISHLPVKAEKSLRAEYFFARPAFDHPNFINYPSIDALLTDLVDQINGTGRQKIHKTCASGGPSARASERLKGKLWRRNASSS